jgi:hypothetical protein
MNAKRTLLLLLALVLGSAKGNIIYVDATHGAAGNTSATDGSPTASWLNAVSNTGTALANQWMLRTPVGTNGTVYQAFHSGSQVTELTTAVTGLLDGVYDVWVFFWDGDTTNQWTISAGLTSGSLTTYSFDGPGNTTLPVAASTLNFSSAPPMFTEAVRTLYGVKIGQSNISGGVPLRVFVNNLVGGSGPNRTFYDGVGFTRVSALPLNSGPLLLGIDFNRNDVLGSPSQSPFRSISGSATQNANSSSYTKKIGVHQITVSQPSGTPFEFRGANGDSSRATPGGDTSRSFLVSDFIGSRQGAIDVDIANLAAGNYVFRSFHLDSLTSSTLGFAQGSTATTSNTIEARIGGVLQDSIRPTALGSAGLNTTVINDSQIPRLEFEVNHSGNSPLKIELRSTRGNGSDNFLLMNGFALYPKTP